MDSGVGSSDQQFLHGFRSSDGFLNQGEMQGDRLHRAAILVRKRKCGFLGYSRSGHTRLIGHPIMSMAVLFSTVLIESDLEVGFWDPTSVLFPFIAVKMEHHLLQLCY
ncbi:hypothetical protein NC653_005501 [Populus alba x Populus x berolinensis]|uniref:Uncharacterized protein n=1 Tax=Populus alba x Populus x berolinensis TaxID=444605 RepID=A0AAD6RCF0_9ROSI|nr:hypothetical protein NC653_005501 [Populus alba x Populus x berolinensis]